MKVTDYIIEFLIDKGISDIFGYPGGVICHFIDSTTKYLDKINAHINYHEQASAFAACGYAQASGKLGVAYTTSGPGATNLVTGVANAYFDSIPTMFFTGQVDTYGLKGSIPIRQRGFQETDVVSIVNGITKYAVRIDNPEDIRYELEKAYYKAVTGNPGPVVIDLPADVQRAEVDVNKLHGYEKTSKSVNDYNEEISYMAQVLNEAKRPCLLVGNGVKQSGMKVLLKRIAEYINIPMVFSMPAFDTLPYEHNLNFGFIGANGHRYGNFVLGKSDLIITIGSRLDLKQVGNNREKFAEQARIIRIDIDKLSFEYKVHQEEKQIQADVRDFLPQWFEKLELFKKVDSAWVDVCGVIKEKLLVYDDESYTSLICKFGEYLRDNTSITVDVGQSQVWLAQQLHIKDNQNVHMSAGHGSMGYSLPAAIGAYYGLKKPVYCFNGDGGIQMNLQELQYLSREKLPVTVVVINNRALGMIRGFQEANFEQNYAQTIEGTGYSTPDFSKIAKAYDIPYICIEEVTDIEKLESVEEGPKFVEIVIPVNTILKPNFGANGFIQDQRPYIDRELYEELMKL